MKMFRIELSDVELKILQGFLSNNPKGGNEILTHISEGIENALSEHPLFDGKVKELKTVNQWGIRLGIRLLDASYYKDRKLYTAKEFEDLVPGNIQV